MANRYKNVNIDKRYNQKRTRIINSRETTIYENSPKTNDDIYVIAQEGDRLDNLAQEYYGDSSYWWFIARSNNIHTMNIEAGTRLRIPPSLENAKTKK